MNGIYLCPECGRMTSINYVSFHRIKKGGKVSKCLNEECNGEMFECDEEMAIPIAILNRKGYTTRYCCSGHLYQTLCRGYISFAAGIELESIPKGWFIEARDEAMLNHSVIRYAFSESDISKRRHKIHRKINALIRWAEELESRKEE